MKKAFVLLVLLIAVISACQKSDSLNQPTTYRVNGITDLTLSYDSLSASYIGWSVDYVGPIQESVTLSLSGLPAGVMIDTTSQSIMSGIPTFTSNFRIVNATGHVVAGTYKVTLKCSGSKTGDKTYTFNLKVLAKPVCTGVVVGTWDSTYDYCSPSGTYYPSGVTADASVANRIHFTNFQDIGVDVYADLNCATGSFVIPSQSIGGLLTVSGSGYFYHDYISYNVTETTSSGTTYCNGTLMGQH